MTALNLAVQPERRAAFLIMDAAHTAVDGRVKEFGSKMIRFERFPAAIGFSGNINILRIGHAIAERQPRNLRSLIQAIPGCLEAECRILADEHGLRRDQAIGTQ